MTADRGPNTSGDRARDEQAAQRGLPGSPLPAAAQVEEVMLAITSEAVVLAEDLLDLTAAALGLDIEDDATLRLLERAEEVLLGSGFGPLVLIPGDRTVHVEALARGVVLTHTLTEDEVETGLLPVDFDLALFVDVPEPVCDGEPLAVHVPARNVCLWEGPVGWLARFGAGTTVAVRVAEDWETVTLQPVELPTPGVDLVKHLAQVYEEEVAEPGLPVPGIDLLVGICVRDRSTFATPQWPLTDLCDVVDLEVRDGHAADGIEIWNNLRTSQSIGRIMERAGWDRDLSRAGVELLDVATRLLDGEVGDEDLDQARVTSALNSLGDLSVVALVEDLLAEPHRNEDGRAAVEALLPLADGGRQVASARYVAALHAERLGDALAAEQLLESALEAKGDHPFALGRLGWYASDRGDAARAAKLWRRLPARDRPAEDLAVVQAFIRSAQSVELSRNAPCWCGSGRKFKRCHLGQAEQAPLPDRVGWLAHKAAAYLLRDGGAGFAAMFEVAAVLAGPKADEAAVMSAMGDPLTLDLVLVETGWWDAFLEDRGVLLPKDEALLAAAWLAVERSVHEVLAVAPGEGVTVRDLRTGDVVEVRERTFSAQAGVGQRVCGRVLPDGQGHQFSGSLFVVPVGAEIRLLEVLDGGDPLDIADWMHAVSAPLRLVTREGEAMVQCRVEVKPANMTAAESLLDDRFEPEEDRWVATHELEEGDRIVRAWVVRVDDRLIVEANAEERVERVLDELFEVTEFEVVSDERIPIESPADLPEMGGPASDGPDAEFDPADMEAIQAQFEERWVRESVPALGGLTPREAADDPTHRDEVIRLIDSFDAMPVPDGALTMRPARLRELLGLNRVVD